MLQVWAGVGKDTHNLSQVPELGTQQPWAYLPGESGKPKEHWELNLLKPGLSNCGSPTRKIIIIGEPVKRKFPDLLKCKSRSVACSSVLRSTPSPTPSVMHNHVWAPVIKVACLIGGEGTWAGQSNQLPSLPFVV